MRLLYTTDIHGDTAAYHRLPELCRRHGVSTIICGGDMLPTGRDMLAAQQAYLNHDLPEILDRYLTAGLTFYTLFGNDDLLAVHAQWLALIAPRPAVHDLTLRWYDLPGGYHIRGNSFVPDYPFGLKDWCLRDAPDAEPVPTRGRALVTSPEGIQPITDLRAFFTARPTVYEHLESITDPAIPMSRTIMVTHAPPAGLGLGTLWNEDDVGSKSVRTWIDHHQPLLTLSGHIHESPDAEREFRGQPWHTARSGTTTCHQPGQVLPRQLTYSIIELPSEADDRVRIEWHREDVPRPDAG